MYLTFTVLLDADETVLNLESLYDPSSDYEARYPCEKRAPGCRSSCTKNAASRVYVACHVSTG